MIFIDKKIYQILKKNFGIKQSSISVTTNLTTEFNLCNWELDLLYAKLELAFGIEIKNPIPKKGICIKKIHQQIIENGYKK